MSPKRLMKNTDRKLQPVLLDFGGFLGAWTLASPSYACGLIRYLPCVQER